MMKFNSLPELMAKVNALETPLYEKYSEAFEDAQAIYEELAKIINAQLANAHLIPKPFQNLFLYVNGTNSYVSCLWYDPEHDKIQEDYGFAVVTFIAYQDPEMELDEDFIFYFFIIETLKRFRLTSIHPLKNITIYEGEDGDEPEPLHF